MPVRIHTATNDQLVAVHNWGEHGEATVYMFAVCRDHDAPEVILTNIIGNAPAGDEQQGAPEVVREAVEQRAKDQVEPGLESEALKRAVIARGLLKPVALTDIDDDVESRMDAAVGELDRIILEELNLELTGGGRCR